MTSLQAALAEVPRQLTLEDILGEIEAEENPVRGDCPHVAYCRRVYWRKLPHYRGGYRCHWTTWGDWRRCGRYQELEGNGHG